MHIVGYLDKTRGMGRKATEIVSQVNDRVPRADHSALSRVRCNVQYSNPCLHHHQRAQSIRLSLLGAQKDVQIGEGKARPKASLAEREGAAKVFQCT